MNGYYRYFLPVKLKVLERDGYKCRHCGKAEKLKIHHKDKRGWSYFNCSYSKKSLINNDMDNLLTLCSSCHLRLHRRDTSLRKEKATLMLRRMEGKTYQAIGVEFGVSRQRIHQIVSE